MNKYRVYEDYEYTLVYDVEANSFDEALEMIKDDPYEYRNLDEDRDDVLVCTRYGTFNQ